MIITFDGPTASGKSRISQMLAKDLKHMYLNTGLLYRAFAHALVDKLNYSKENLASPKTSDVDFIKNSKIISYQYDNNKGAIIIYEGKDLTDRLKFPDADQWASIASTNQEVRDALLEIQRELSKKNDVIAEGRDCGTVVFPDANFKFFLTASENVRAARWQRDQKNRGNLLSYDEAIDSLLERDTRDTQREIAPLTVPNDAYIIDSSNLTLEEVLRLIKKHIKNKVPIGSVREL